MLFKGITKLSELQIDSDKNWNTKGITSIKEVAAAMSRGDIVVRGDSVLVRLAAGADGYALTSQGQGKLPVWAPAGGALKYYFPVTIDLLAQVIHIAAADQSINKNAPLVTTDVEAYDDQPLLNINQIRPELDSTASATRLAAADYSEGKNARFKAALSILVDGFVEETAAGVQTDHTAEARDDTANDLNMNPMSDTVLDKVYIGSNYKFWQIQANVGISGVGNWTNVWYYWNGAAWTTVVDELDGSNEWQHGTGIKLISHTPQADWATTTIQGMDLYWLMSRTDNFVNRTTKPLGTQLWVALGG
jgi:hypothetical protein